MYQFFGKDLKYDDSLNLGKLINESHAKNVASFLENCGGIVVIGGEIDIKNKYCQPTLILNPDPNHKIMHEEVFGPICPV